MKFSRHDARVNIWALLQNKNNSRGTRYNTPSEEVYEGRELSLASIAKKYIFSSQLLPQKLVQRCSFRRIY